MCLILSHVADQRFSIRQWYHKVHDSSVPCFVIRCCRRTRDNIEATKCTCMCLPLIVPSLCTNFLVVSKVKSVKWPSYYAASECSWHPSVIECRANSSDSAKFHASLSCYSRETIAKRDPHIIARSISGVLRGSCARNS